jgi:hypothetical protein
MLQVKENVDIPTIVYIFEARFIRKELLSRINQIYY